MQTHKGKRLRDAAKVIEMKKAERYKKNTERERGGGGEEERERERGTLYDVQIQKK